jgi:hypothetical protein
MIGLERPLRSILYMRGHMYIRRLIAAASVFGVMAGVAVSATATPFTPVIDEFWVMKGASLESVSQVFRNSFNDGIAPPSGPQDININTQDTYNVFGAGGITGESGGKLTLTPSNGDTVLITNAFADVTTVVTKRRTTATGNAVNSLEVTDAFEIHGLFDLTSLPAFSGQAFGIRTSDRALPGNEGNDTIQLIVGRNVNTGVLGVALHELDFINDTIDRVDFIDLEALLTGGVATQIELVISKEANTAEIGAFYRVYGLGGMLGGNVLGSAALDPFSTEQNANLAIYNGEDYTRAQFVANDRIAVPAPATLALFALGLGAMMRLRRRAA